MNSKKVSIGTLFLGTIEEQLTCKICLDIFTNPKILPCHHSFCCQCLQRMPVLKDKDKVYNNNNNNNNCTDTCIYIIE